MNKEIVKRYGFFKELKLIESGKCPFCESFIRESKFKDRLSHKEYSISGLCQSCQDGFFEKASPEFCDPRKEIFIAITRAKKEVFLNKRRF